MTWSDDRDTLARAARLNRANIDAESGAVDRARDEYDALLALDLSDTATRHSRALVELRMGQPDRAEKDLSALLEMGLRVKRPGEILGARATARLLAGRTAEALKDASEARRDYPCPAHERLWQRARSWPIAGSGAAPDRPPRGHGPALRSGRGAAGCRPHRAAASWPGETSHLPGRDAVAYRAALTRSVILATLGRHDEAVAAATWALALSPFSPDAYLIRARVLSPSGGDRRAAFADVELRAGGSSDGTSPG